jgi:O-acetyl-ADP-ribose deacetylase (regulator of RNase III)
LLGFPARRIFDVDAFVVRLLLEGGRSLEICGPDDITKETTDAIVNAANSSLLGGGGVDGAIHRAGGPAILEECKVIRQQIGHLPEGKAVITTGGRLRAKHVIHTVGPIYADGKRGEPEVLSSAFRESMKVADDHGIASLAFPSISTGTFLYPVKEAAKVAVGTVLESLRNATHLKQVRFVLFDDYTLSQYEMAATREAMQKPKEIQIIKGHS